MVQKILQKLSDNQRAIAGQTAVQVIGKAVTVLGSFLVVRILTSQSGLGVDGYGSYALVVGFVAYFYLLLDFGFNSVFVQLATDKPEESQTYFDQLVTLRIVLSLALMGLGLAILAFLPGDRYSLPIKLGIIAGLSSVLLQGLFMSGNAYFQLKLKYQHSVAIAVLGAALNLMITFIAMRSHFGLTGALIGYLSEYVVLGAGAVVIISQSIRWQISFDWAAIWHIVKVATPLGLSIVLTILYFRSDTFLLSILPLDPSLGYNFKRAVSLYTIPYAMFEVSLTLPAFLMNAVYPLMLKAYQQSLDSLLGLAKKVLAASVAGSLVLVAGIWLFAPLVIHLQTANNPDFTPSIWVLRLLSLGIPVFFVTNILVWNLVTMQRRRWLPVVYLLAGVFNISANLWLLPHYGIIAAALTTGATEVVVLILLLPITFSAVNQIHRLRDQSQPAVEAGDQ